MTFTPPMLAVKSKHDFSHYAEDGSWVAQPKLDGIRVIVNKDKFGDVTIYSRTGKDLSLKFPQITSWFQDHDGVDFTVDGEIVVVKEMARLKTRGSSYSMPVPIVDFEATQSIVNSLAPRAVAVTEAKDHDVQFWAFDILDTSGVDMTDKDYSIRISTLHIVLNLGSHPGPVSMTQGITFDFKQLYDDYTEIGGEGIILKSTNSHYFPGKRRAKTWYKFKEEDTYDVIIVGFQKGLGKYEGSLGAIEFGAYTPDYGAGIKYIGKCSGMTDDMRSEIWFNQGAYLGKVIEIKSNGLVGSGEYGSPRHPQFLRVRDDKLAINCDIEQFINPSYKPGEIT
jgi:DNA ligase 1